MDMMTMNCYKCKEEMSMGFSSKNASLSYVAPEETHSFVFVDEDLNKAGLKTMLPSKASWVPAHICRNCEIVIVEYGTVFSTAEMKKLAKLM